jgi:hypothetical protein
MRRLVLLILIAVLEAIPVDAQVRLPSSIDVLLGAHDVLHVADMVSTSYGLTRGRAFGARESNPFLKPFGGSPTMLAGVSSAIDVLQVAVIKRVERRHPRWAIASSAALVALEVWATTNNIAAAGRIHQRRLAAGR